LKHGKHQYYLTNKDLLKMPRTFEEAQTQVLKELEKMIPDNGLEAMWISHLIGSAKAMTETSMHAVLSRYKIGTFDNEKQVASDIYALMR
jgi:hypothetical protein